MAFLHLVARFVVDCVVNGISMYVGVGTAVAYNTYNLLRREPPPHDESTAPLYPVLRRGEALTVALATGAAWPKRAPLLGAALFEQYHQSEIRDIARSHVLTVEQAITIMSVVPRLALISNAVTLGDVARRATGRPANSPQ